MVTRFYSCEWIQGTMTDGHRLVGRGKKSCSSHQHEFLLQGPSFLQGLPIFNFNLFFFTIFKCIQSNLKFYLGFQKFSTGHISPTQTTCCFSHQELSHLSFTRFINPPAPLCLPIWIYLFSLSIFLFLPFWLFSVTQGLKLFYFLNDFDCQNA